MEAVHEMAVRYDYAMLWHRVRILAKPYRRHEVSLAWDVDNAVSSVTSVRARSADFTWLALR